MAKAKKEPTPHSIIIEVGGKKYSGNYTVTGNKPEDLIDVYSDSGHKRTQLGGLNNNSEGLAKLILSELVNEVRDNSAA